MAAESDPVGDRPALTDVEITPQMIEAGVRAYLEQASHDEFSSLSPPELIQLVLERALHARKMT